MKRVSNPRNVATLLCATAVVALVACDDTRKMSERPAEFWYPIYLPRGASDRGDTLAELRRVGVRFEQEVPASIWLHVEDIAEGMAVVRTSIGRTQGAESTYSYANLFMASHQALVSELTSQGVPFEVRPSTSIDSDGNTTVVPTVAFDEDYALQVYEGIEVVERRQYAAIFLK